MNEQGTVSGKFKDTKDILLMLNCHTTYAVKTRRRLKTEEECDFPRSDVVAVYNRFMGNVDLTDQKIIDLWLR